MSWTNFAFLGVGFMFVGFCLVLKEHFWLSGAQVAQGTVIDLISHGSGRKPSYAPKVRFTMADGTEHTFTRGYSSNPVGFKVGDAVMVAYYSQTTESRILTFGQRFGFASYLLSIGLGLMCLATCYTLGNSMVPSMYLQNAAAIVSRME
jgi:Protein of unknown function (DUF3592)